MAAIIVCHLTRMKPGFICVAGVERETGQATRPMPPGKFLSRTSLCRYGGAFDIASVVELGFIRDVGCAPEVEDRHFWLPEAERLEEMAPDAFWNLLQQNAKARLTEIFGPDLLPVQGGMAVDLQKGRISLGFFRPAAPPALYIDSLGKVRLEVTEGRRKLRLPVTDLRLYRADQQTPRQDLLAPINLRMRRGVPVILGVGLTRPWSKEDAEVKRHWLQVNNLHLQDNPVWTDRSLPF